MSKNEFETLVSCSVSDTDYSLVEFVYTWHPSISEVKGKSQVAQLYLATGMTVFGDMYDRAKMAQIAENEICAARRTLDEKLAVMEDLRNLVRFCAGGSL